LQIARAESAAARVVDRANVNLIYTTNLDARAPEPTVVRSDDVVGIFNEAHRGVLARVIAEQRKEMHSHVKDAVGRLEREIFVLRSEFALERQVRALHDEVAAARAAEYRNLRLIRGTRVAVGCRLAHAVDAARK
jgi:hypothetical protein